MRVVSANDESAAVEVARLLRAGGVACVPTDTAYGLAVDPMNPSAVDRLYRIKGRAEDKPILLLVDSMAMAATVGEPGPLFDRLAAAFWPGPLTLVLRARSSVPDRVTAGSGKIGLRWPDDGFAQALVGAFGGAVTATSANRSGQPATWSASEAVQALGKDVDLYVDGGRLEGGNPSTVLDTTTEPPALIREGALGSATIAKVLGGRLAKPA